MATLKEGKEWEMGQRGAGGLYGGMQCGEVGKQVRGGEVWRAAGDRGCER